MKGFLKKIIKGNLLKYIGIGYISAILNILLNLLLIRFLTPLSLGKVTLGKSIFQSFEYSHLGLRNGLDRWFPYCTKQEERNIIFSVAYIFSFISSSLFVLFWVLYYPDDILFYLCFSLSGLLYTIVMLYRIYYRAFEEKKDFINISFAITLFPLLIQIIGLLLFNVNGFIIFHLLSYLISLFICYYFFGIKIYIISKEIYPILKKLLSSGFLLFLSALINFIATTGDRFFIAEYWGLELLGVYGVIMFFFTAYSIFSLNYTELIMNKIMLSPSLKFIMKHISLVIFISILLILLTFPIIPFFMNIFMHQYLAYLSSIRLILIAIIPYAALPILNYTLHALDKRNVLLIINIICTALYFIVLLVILSTSKKIEYLVYLKIIFSIIVTLLTFGSFLYYINIKRKDR
jgi:O-antigen/teichoic acid export membrane protein